MENLNICMLYNPDEEIGSRYSREKMDEIGRKADIIVVMESAGNKGTRHCFARKGSMGYELEFHGQAAHAGLCSAWKTPPPSWRWAITSSS